MERINATTGSYNFIDLFAGAGGLSEGFIQAGFSPVAHVEMNPYAAQTLETRTGYYYLKAQGKLDIYKDYISGKITRDEFLQHIPEEQLQSVFCETMSNETLPRLFENIDRILTQRGIKQVDVIIGGPPCQGFSVAGPRDMNDKRNTLYLAMVKLAATLKPQAVVLENVPGMLQTNGGIGAKRIIEDFAEIGYKMTPKLLYAPDYGIPQIRKRVFFVGLRDSENAFEFPEPFVDSKDYVTCEDAISDLPSLQTSDGEIVYGEEIQEYETEPKTEYQKMMRKNSKSVRNHIGSIPIEKTKKMISLVPEGKNYKALPEEYRGMYKYHEALTRYNSKKPSLTINTGHRSHFHYKYNRIPTVRESARSQSFPDDFIFYGNKSQQYKQGGNAVPPMLEKMIEQNMVKNY